MAKIKDKIYYYPSKEMTRNRINSNHIHTLTCIYKNIQQIKDNQLITLPIEDFTLIQKELKTKKEVISLVDKFGNLIVRILETSKSDEFLILEKQKKIDNLANYINKIEDLIKDGKIYSIEKGHFIEGSEEELEDARIKLKENKKILANMRRKLTNIKKKLKDD